MQDSLSYGVPLIPHSISFWLKQGIDRIIINGFYGATAVGLFGFSGNFSSIINIFGQAFNATNSVYVFKNMANEQPDTRKKLKKQIFLMAVIFALITVLVCVSIRFVIERFFPAYSDCINFVYIQCVTAYASCIYILFVNFIFFFKKTKVLMIITFSFSVLQAVMSFWLTRYSIYYTLIIGLICQCLITVSVVIYSQKLYRIIIL